MALKRPEGMSDEEFLAYANEKARKKKEARDKMLANKTNEKGLVIVHTGKGKGKSTAHSASFSVRWAMACASALFNL